MPFTFLKNRIEGVLIIEPKVFPDERGVFFENYKKSDFLSNGIRFEFVQDNTSLSDAGVIRGLHFQTPPYEQGKLVRAITGEILDVVVDLRKGSPTYGNWLSEILSENNKKMLWVPPGFAHGFLTLSASTVHYKVTNEYNKDAERGLRFDDPRLNIAWGHNQPRLSEKDENWPFLENLSTPFSYSKGGSE